MRRLVLSCVIWAVGCGSAELAGLDASVSDAATPDAHVSQDAAAAHDAAVAHDAIALPDAYVSADVGPDDAHATPDAYVAPDAYVSADAYVVPDAGCSPTERVCAGSCVDVVGSIDHCGDCTTTCTTTTAHAHPTCISSACGSSCDPGYVASGTSCVLGVLDLRGDPFSTVPLGDYRAFRGAITSFQYDQYTFTLAGPTRVQIDLMGNVQAELTDAQITSGDAITSSPSGYVSPSPASWGVDDLTTSSYNELCWSQDGFSCPAASIDDIRFLHRSPSSDGMWDGDRVLPAGDYQIRVARGSASGPSSYDTFHYYGEIVLTPQ